MADPKAKRNIELLTRSDKARKFSRNAKGALAAPAAVGSAAYVAGGENAGLAAAGATGVASGAYLESKMKGKKLDPKSKNIAILTGNPKSGGGHASAAKAVAENLQGKGYNVDVIDVKSYRKGGIGEADKDLLFKSTNRFGDSEGMKSTERHMWKSRNWDAQEGGSRIKNVLKKTLHRAKENVQGLALGDYALGQDLDKKDYRAVINTIPGGESGLKGSRKKTINLTTDYGVMKPLWQSETAGGYIVPTKDTKFDKGTTKSVGSLPLSRAHIDAKDDKSKALEAQKKRLTKSQKMEKNLPELKKLDPGKKWIMVAGGSTGVSVEHSTDALQKAISKRPDADKYQVVSFAGPSNPDLDDYLKNKYKGSKSVAVLSEGDFPSMMRSSDIIVTRPGGATTNELRLHGKPTIAGFSSGKQIRKYLGDDLKSGKPGHEWKNYKFLEKDIGTRVMFADEPDQVSKTLDDVIKNEGDIRAKAESSAKKLRSTDYGSQLDEAIQSISKNIPEGKKSLLPKTPAGKLLIGGGLALGAAAAGKTYNEKRKKS